MSQPLIPLSASGVASKAIVSVNAGHTLSINAENLPSDWLHVFIILLNNSHLSVLVLN